MIFFIYLKSSLRKKFTISFISNSGTLKFSDNRNRENYPIKLKSQLILREYPKKNNILEKHKFIKCHAVF